jgi:quinol monooxygenase YgiN
MIVLAVRYQGHKGRGDEIAEAMREMVALARAEEGCELSTEDPDVFVLHEHYRDEQSFDAHLQTEHFKRIVEGRVVPMLESRVRERAEPVEP